MKKFTATYFDYNKNARKLTATSEWIQLKNQHGISLGLTHLSHLIKSEYRRALNGNTAEESYLRNLISNCTEKAVDNDQFIQLLNLQLTRSAFI